MVLPLGRDAVNKKFPPAGDDAEGLAPASFDIGGYYRSHLEMEVEMPTNTPRSSARPRRLAGPSFRRGLLAASTVLVTVGSLIAGANASVVHPGTQQVLHYFSKFETQVFQTSAGKPFSPSQKNPPVPGDSIDSTNLDYVGDNAHHAANWTASDHELCILDNKGDAVCQAEVAIGGSMILAHANLGHVSASTTTSTFQVTGGTGTFEGVTGTIVAVQLDPSSQTSDSEATITLQRP
jgi:hypothetical protein